MRFLKEADSPGKVYSLNHPYPLALQPQEPVPIFVKYIACFVGPDALSLQEGTVAPIQHAVQKSGA